MYSTQTVVHLTPDQLEEIVERAIKKQLNTFVPPVPEGANLPELLTRKQAAEALQVSLTTLHFWAKDTPERLAILVPFKVGNRVRYRRENVLMALKESRRFKAPKA